MSSIFIINQLIAKHRKFNLEIHIAFIDSEKTLDREARGKLWNTLKENCYSLHLTQTAEKLCNEKEIITDKKNSLSEAIITNQRVKQDCCLSPTLFSIHIDHVIK